MVKSYAKFVEADIVLGLLQAVEDFANQHIIPELANDTFAVAIFPRSTG
jgi:hypothetical protein